MITFIHRQKIIILSLVIVLGILHASSIAETRAVGQSVEVSASIEIVCGNNIFEVGEQCDGTSLGGQSCVSRGFGGGTLSCNSECHFVTAECIVAPVGGGGGGGGSVFLPLQTEVIFSGRAYPLSRITILKDGQKALITVAGPDAIFEASLGGLSSGDYVFSVYGEDNDGRRSTSFTFPVYVTKGAATRISSIFISPTITVDKQEVKKGDNIAIFGKSAPYANITIAVNSENEFFEKTTADKDGAFIRYFDTSLLGEGRHFTKAKGEVENYMSSFSDLVGFLVGDKTIEAVKQRLAEKGDMNKDKRVNLLDFSILAFWYDRSFPPKDADMNADGKINLTDFSVIAFYWTG